MATPTREDGLPLVLYASSPRNGQEMQQGKHRKHASDRDGGSDGISFLHPNIQEDLGGETQHRYDQRKQHWSLRS